MKALLKSIGIDHSGSFIYEYSPINLPWWDYTHETAVEIEIHQAKDGFQTIEVIFTPEAEGVLKRTLIFYTALNGTQLADETLVAKPVFEQLALDFDLMYSDELSAYEVSTYAQTQRIFAALLQLLKLKAPVQQFDLDELEDDDFIPEIGDTLNHFIAMMHLNNAPYTERNVTSHLQTAVTLEGTEYLTELLADVNSGETFDFEAEYGIAPATLNMLMASIREYPYQN